MGREYHQVSVGGSSQAVQTMKIKNNSTDSSRTPPRWPIVGSMGLLIALGIGVIAWLGPSTPDSLENRISRYKEQEFAASPYDRYAEAKRHLEDLEKLKEDSDFGKLPVASQ